MNDEITANSIVAKVKREFIIYILYYKTIYIIFFVTQRAKARKYRENSPSIFSIIRSILLLYLLLYCTKIEFHRTHWTSSNGDN
ncbi:hypothetical protein ALC53_09466 [Atta colombica]|uniref:Uncharacterized protein n=1 Tax=Atta colombica TaxID=520822 RepID=A0A195B803_9HYME|nr:hypothetical protein ALC53_09466 [Atta colombica]